MIVMEQSLQSRLQKSRQLRDNVLAQSLGNSCSVQLYELKITSFSLPQRGYIYFSWVWQQSQTQSLKYDSNSKHHTVDEVLIMAIRTDSQNKSQGKTQLKLLAEDGHLLDSVCLPLIYWTSQVSPLTVSIGKGVVDLEVRKKAAGEGEEGITNSRLTNSRSLCWLVEKKELLPESNHLHASIRKQTNLERRNESQMQAKLPKKESPVLRHKDSGHQPKESSQQRKEQCQSHEESGKQCKEEAGKQHKQSHLQRMASQVQQRKLRVQRKLSSISYLNASTDNVQLHQQLMCKRKEFEDVVYLNNKLKNDREVLITLKEELSSELGSVYQNIGTDMASLEGHYQKRLLLRERVYLEAIRQLVDKCNTDALACQRVVQTLLLERMALEEDVKLRDKAIADQKTLMEDLVSSDAARTEIITSLQSKNRDLEIQVDALSQEVERTRVDREDLTKKIQYLESQLSFKASEQQEQQVVYEETIRQSLAKIVLFQSQLASKNQTLRQVQEQLHQCQSELQFNEGLLQQMAKQHEQHQKELNLHADECQGKYQRMLINIKQEMDAAVARAEGFQAVCARMALQIQEMEKLAMAKTEAIVKLTESNEKALGEKRGCEIFIEEQRIEISRLQSEYAKISQQAVIRNCQSVTKDSPSHAFQNSKQHYDQPAQIQLEQHNHKQLKQSIRVLETKLKSLEEEGIERQVQLRQRENIVKDKERELTKALQDRQRVQKEAEEMQKTLEAAERQNFLLQQRLSQLEQLLAEAGRKESKGQDSKESSKAIEKLERITNLVQRRNKDKAMPERRTGSNADRIGSKADHTGKAHHTGKADHTGRANLTGKANQTGKANHTGRADRKESKYLKSSDYLAERGKSVYREKEKLQEIDDFWPPGLKTEHSRDSFCSEEAHSNDVQTELENILQQEQDLEEQLRRSMNKIQELKRVGGQEIQAMRREAEQSEKNMVVQLREAEEETEAAKIRVDKLESVIEEMAAEVREAQTAKESAKCSFEFKIKELLQQASEEREKRIVDIEKVKELEKYLLKVENELKQQRQQAQENKMTYRQVVLQAQQREQQVKRLRELNDQLRMTVNNEAVLRDFLKRIEQLNNKCSDAVKKQQQTLLQKEAADQQAKLVRIKWQNQLQLNEETERKRQITEQQTEDLKFQLARTKRQAEQLQEELRRAHLLRKDAQEEIGVLLKRQAQQQKQRKKHLEEAGQLQKQLVRKQYELSRISKEFQKLQKTGSQFQEAESQLQRNKMHSRDHQDRSVEKLIQAQEAVIRMKSQLQQAEKLVRETEKLCKQTQAEKVKQEQAHENKAKQYEDELRQKNDELQQMKSALEDCQKDNAQAQQSVHRGHKEADSLRSELQRMQYLINEWRQKEGLLIGDLQHIDQQYAAAKASSQELARRLVEKQAQCVDAQREVKDLQQDKQRQSKWQKKCQQNNQLLKRKIEELQLAVKVKNQEIEALEHKCSLETEALGELKAQLHTRSHNIQLNTRIHNTQLNTRIHNRLPTQLNKGVQFSLPQDIKIDKKYQVSGEQDKGSQKEKLLAGRAERLENEILQLYNENSLVKQQLQVTSEQHAMCGLQIQQRVQLHARQLREKDDKLTRLQLELELLTVEKTKQEQTSRQQEQCIEALASELSLANKKLSEKCNLLEQAEAKYSCQKQCRQTAESVFHKQSQEAKVQLQQALEQMVESRHQYEKEKREQEQQYEVRIISLEVEIQKQKDKQDSLGQEHVQKLKMLELALSDVQKLLDKKEQALAVEYQAELARIEDGINHRVTAKERENHELHHSIQQLVSNTQALQKENIQLKNTLQTIKAEWKAEEDIYTRQIHSLSCNFREAQREYKCDIAELEKQHRLMQDYSQKSTEADNRAVRLKEKDVKIQQLRIEVVALQEALVKARKRQVDMDRKQEELQSQVNANEMLQYKEDKLGEELADAVRKNSQQQLELERGERSRNDLIKKLSREKEDRAQEAAMLRDLLEDSSRSCKAQCEELRTMQTQEQLLKNALRQQEVVVVCLRAQHQKMKMQYDKIQAQCERAFEESRGQKEQFDRRGRVIEEDKDQLIRLREQVRRLTALNQDWQRELKNVHEQHSRSMSMFTQLTQQARTAGNEGRDKQEERMQTIQALQERVQQMERLNEALKQRNKQLLPQVEDYRNISLRCHEQYQCSPAQLLEEYHRCATRIARFEEHIEETHFLQQRRATEEDSLRKENALLQLELGELKEVNEKLAVLRRAYEKLQRQKKQACFREEVLNLQFAGRGETQETKARIHKIMNCSFGDSVYRCT